MLLMSDSSPARLLISWFELVHPIHCSADRIFRWVDEQSLMEKHDSYSMFTCWTCDCRYIFKAFLYSFDNDSSDKCSLEFNNVDTVSPTSNFWRYCLSACVISSIMASISDLVASTDFFLHTAMWRLKLNECPNILGNLHRPMNF